MVVQLFILLLRRIAKKCLKLLLSYGAEVKIKHNVSYENDYKNIYRLLHNNNNMI